MRGKLVMGNWKMNTRLSEAVELASSVRKALSPGDLSKVSVVLFPPFIHIHEVITAVKGSGIGVGGQNASYEKSGAFTGEVAPGMLKDAGCGFVILGHSERRHVFGESDEVVNKKIKASLAEGLVCVFCVGEKLDEREAGRTEEVIRRQVEKGLSGIDASGAARIVVAYEPVWAIGTGRNATAAQAQEVHAFIRGLVRKAYGDGIASAMLIAYGGSVKAENSKEIITQPDVDGALVGGASLVAGGFVNIVRSSY